MADLASLVNTNIGKETVMPTPDVMGAVVKGAQVAQLQQQTQAGYQNQAIQQQQQSRQEQFRNIYAQNTDPTTGQVDYDRLGGDLSKAGLGPEAMDLQNNLLTQKSNAAKAQIDQLSALNTKSLMAANTIFGLKQHTGDLFDNPDKYNPNAPATAPTIGTANIDQRSAVAQQAMQRYGITDPNDPRIQNIMSNTNMNIASLATPGAGAQPYTLPKEATGGVTPTQMGAYQAAYKQLADLGFTDKIQSPEQFANDPKTAVDQLNALYDESGQYFKEQQLHADLAMKDIDMRFKAAGILREQALSGLAEARTTALNNKGTGTTPATPDENGLVSVDTLPKDSGVKKLVDNWITQRQSGSSRNILTNQVAAINTAKEGLAILDQNPTGLEVQKVMQDLGGLKNDPWIGSTAASVLSQVTGLEKGTLSPDKISDMKNILNNAVAKAQAGIKQNLTIPAGYSKYREVQDIVHTYDNALQPIGGTPTKSKFIVGKTYTDKAGKQAIYQADGSWKEL